LGIEVHGSLQCPYYVHTALMRALGLDRDRVVVVQEETGGAFGGKEEYPSMLAAHVALLAAKAGALQLLAPDRHVAGTVGDQHIAAVDGVVGAAERELALILLRKLGEIGGFGFHHVRERAIAFRPRPMTNRAMFHEATFAGLFNALISDGGRSTHQQDGGKAGSSH
jgi:xanthine dehydrogenase molybdopterin-binding subunit B